MKITVIGHERPKPFDTGEFPEVRVERPMDTIYILQNSGDCPDLEISPAMARGLISALERLLRSASEAPPSASNDATPPAGLTEREQFIWRLGFNLGRAA